MTVNNNISNNNVFSLFPPYTLEQANADVKTHKVISSDKQKDTVDINNQNKKSNTKKILFGSTLASTLKNYQNIRNIYLKEFRKQVHPEQKIYLIKLFSSREREPKRQ